MSCLNRIYSATLYRIDSYVLNLLILITRMPYLFKPVWGFPEVTLLIACLALFALVSLYSALQLLILFVSWRLKRTKEKLGM